jgi:hypothetical protein
MDALLIPVFVLVSLTVPVLLLALLLYAIPVRAAVTVVLRDRRQTQVLVISWWILGIRTSGTPEGRLTELLIAGHAVFSRTGAREQDGKAGEGTRESGAGSKGVPPGERMPDQPSAPQGQRPDTSLLRSSRPEPLPSVTPGAVAPDTPAPVTGAPAAGPPATGIPEAGIPASTPATGAPAGDFPDIGGIVKVIQNLTGPVGSFSSAFWQQSRFVDARGTVTLGLGDPVLTGELSGMYWASRFVLLASRIYVELEPVFDRTVLELDITVRVKVKHPLLVLLAGLRLALHPAIREAAGIAMRQSRGAAPA